MSSIFMILFFLLNVFLPFFLLTLTVTGYRVSECVLFFYSVFHSSIFGVLFTNFTTSLLLFLSVYFLHHILKASRRVTSGFLKVYVSDLYTITFYTESSLTVALLLSSFYQSKYFSDCWKNFWPFRSAHGDSFRIAVLTQQTSKILEFFHLLQLFSFHCDL